MQATAHSEQIPGPSRYGELYLAARDRIVELVNGTGSAAATTAVPACPKWSVKDVLAHLAGVCADVLAGNVDGAATEAWTQAQVAGRRDVGVDEVLTEWQASAPEFAGMLHNFPGWYGAQIVADITSHEQDLRGALGAAPAMNDGVWCAVNFIVSAAVHPAAVALGVGPLEIRADGATWIVGGKGPGTGEDPAEAVAAAIVTGRPLEPPAAAPVATLTAPPRELCRALVGRRSAAQIRRLGWVGDVESFLPLFAQPPLFRLRQDDLTD